MTDSSLPQGWKHTTIGDLAKVNPEALTSRTPADYAFDYVDIASVTGPDKVLPPQPLLYGEAPSRARRVVRQGDMIIATVRPYLRAFAMMRRPVQDTICSTGFAVVRARQPQLAEYLYQWFLSPWFLQHAEARMVGSNYPAISAEDVEDFTILLPPADEAERVAAILRSVDEAIERTEAVIAALREVKRGMMQELLTKGIGHTEFHETKAGLVPSTWEALRVRQLGTLATGKTPPTEDVANFGEDIPFVTPGDFGKPKYVARAARGLSHQGVRSSRHVPAGTLLVVCIGSTIGKMGIAGVPVCMNQQVNSLSCKDPEDAEFAYYMLSFRVHHLRQFAGVTAVPILNKGEFGQYWLPWPREEERREIVGRLAGLDEAIERNRPAVDVLGSVKRGLMQQLLTGKVRE